MSDLVSIIIPTYNYGHLINETIESVLNQTYTNWECIIVDDGSTDNTKDVVAIFLKKDNRIKYVYQDNCGTSSAKNKGIEIATGEYLLFLDSDDLLERNKILDSIEIFKNNSSADIVYSEAQLFTSEENNTIVYKDSSYFKIQNHQFNSLIEFLLKTNIFLMGSFIIKREIIKEIGYFSEDLKAVEDWHYWIRIALKDKKFIPITKQRNNKVLIRKHENYFMKVNSRLMKYQTIRFRELLDRELIGMSILRNKNKLYLYNNKLKLNLDSGKVVSLMDVFKYIYYSENKYSGLKIALGDFFIPSIIKLITNVS